MPLLRLEHDVPDASLHLVSALWSHEPSPSGKQRLQDEGQGNRTFEPFALFDQIARFFPGPTVLGEKGERVSRTKRQDAFCICLLRII